MPLNYSLALAVIALQIVSVAFLALFFLRKKFTDLAPISDFLGKWGLWIGFLMSLGGVAISLFYSEILGVLPCGLCWLQRVFLYRKHCFLPLQYGKATKASPITASHFQYSAERLLSISTICKWEGQALCRVRQFPPA